MGSFINRIRSVLESELEARVLNMAGIAHLGDWICSVDLVLTCIEIMMLKDLEHFDKNPVTRSGVSHFLITLKTDQRAIFGTFHTQV